MARGPTVASRRFGIPSGGRRIENQPTPIRMYRRLPGSNTSHAYPSRSQRWLGPALVAGSGALLLGALLTIALSTNALLLFAPSDLTSSPLFIAGRPPRLLYDWTDPNLVDSQEERALARDCVFDSPLDHLALWPALQNASKLPAPSSNGLLNATGWSGPEGWHPLLLLIKEGEERFKAKLASQSRTLAEAEDEYRRRNGGRRPPSGFEVWCVAPDNDVLRKTTDTDHVLSSSGGTLLRRTVFVSTGLLLLSCCARSTCG